MRDGRDEYRLKHLSLWRNILIMANTFSQIYLHIVFAVKYRDGILRDEWRDELFAYMGGIIRNNNHIPVKVGGWRDHVHILAKVRPSVDIPGLVKDIKLSTHNWVQLRQRCRFAWQEGYGCFSVSPLHSQAVIDYIERQPEHHTHIGMADEFRRLLLRNNVDFDERYLPEDVL